LNPYADYTVALMYAFLSSHHLDGPTPKPASYSNLGFGLLGHILCLVHDKSYAELVAEKITRPLGMTDTVILLDDEQQARFAPPHDGQRPAKPWTLPTLAGAGALRSTATDLTKFVQALMTDDQPLKAAWKLASLPRADFGGDKIGLAITIGRRSGDTWYYHGGGTGGYRAQIEFCPATKHGYVLLLNNTAPPPGRIISQLRSAPLDPNREEVPIESAKLADYAGIYRVGDQLEFTVIVGPEKHLLVRMSGQDYGPPLFHAGADRFFSRKVSAEFQFGRASNGRVGSITLIQNGRDIIAWRISEE
jgi:CubicO group peptidase (beta-lactamase class C family)